VVFVDWNCKPCYYPIVRCDTVNIQQKQMAESYGSGRCDLSRYCFVHLCGDYSVAWGRDGETVTGEGNLLALHCSLFVAPRYFRMQTNAFVNLEHQGNIRPSKEQ